jgi:hypothetical protein
MSITPQKMKDPDLKKKWVDDLRQNGHLQGRCALEIEYLEKTSKFCCLGRLAKLVGIPTHDISGLSRDNMSANETGTLFTNDEIPIWVRLDEEDEVKVRNSLGGSSQFHGAGETTSLQSLNDCCVPFSVIADLIEKHL